jgi:hypothetical protein
MAHVVGRTASKPEGPWSEEFFIYNAGDFFFVYSPSQQYKYDSTGKTLVVSFTGYPNIIQAIKVVSFTVLMLLSSIRFLTFS